MTAFFQLAAVCYRPTVWKALSQTITMLFFSGLLLSSSSKVNVLNTHFQLSCLRFFTFLNKLLGYPHNKNTVLLLTRGESLKKYFLCKKNLAKNVCLFVFANFSAYKTSNTRKCSMLYADRPWNIFSQEKSCDIFGK